jgi:SNF family Na+-dependent transporter
MSQDRQQWGSRLGVILAVAGSAVGLGNFLRFPGNAAQNGGGAFMIPYFCALLFLGIPIGWAEWTMGRYGGRKGFHSGPAIMGLFGKGSWARYVGVCTVLIPLGVYFYYVLIESWCLLYFIKFLTGGIGLADSASVAEQVQASTTFFGEVNGSSANGVLFKGGGHGVLLFFAATMVVNFWFLYRGLSKGVEWVCKWAMPTMAIIGVTVLVRVLTLGTPDPAHPEQNVMNGLGFLWNPDFESLGDFKTWVAAAGQIFFSLSVGFGVIINYASYMKRKDDVVLSGLTASATNEFFEVALGGLITITAAVAFLGVTLTSSAAGSSFNLGFNTLPVVFAHMPLGNFFGAIWFLMLFLAAITSSLSMLQPTLAFIQEALDCTRQRATAIVSLWAIGGCLFVAWFSGGLTALDTIDFWVGSFLILVVGLAQVFCFGWVFGLERGIAEAHEGAHIRIPPLIQFVMKYVSPVYLIVVIGGFCWSNLPDYVEQTRENSTAQLTWLLILGTTVALLALIVVGERRWRAKGLDLDGERGPADAQPVAAASMTKR